MNNSLNNLMATGAMIALTASDENSYLDSFAILGLAMGLMSDEQRSQLVELVKQHNTSH